MTSSRKHFGGSVPTNAAVGRPGKLRRRRSRTRQTGKLDANGTMVIQVPTQVDASGDGFIRDDYDYTVEAGVTDAANREITGRGRFLATYGTFRVDIEPLNYAVRINDNTRFNVTTLDYDDKPVSTKVHVQLVFRHYNAGKTETIQGPAVDVVTDATGHGTGQLPIGHPTYSSAELEATASATQAGTRDPRQRRLPLDHGRQRDGLGRQLGGRCRSSPTRSPTLPATRPTSASSPKPPTSTRSS